MKVILSNKSVPRVEIDQRVRDARLRLEQIERLLVPRAAVTASRLRRSYMFSASADAATGGKRSELEGAE